MSSSRRARSRAPSGSSNISSRGRGARARASATRCCSPPDRSVTDAALEARQIHQLQHLRDAAPDLVRDQPFMRRAEGHVLKYVQVRERGRSPERPARSREDEPA